MISPFFKIRRLGETESTNEDAKRAAQEGAGEGLVITATIQTSGKGRQGRVWSSPAGNVYASLLLRPACDAQAASLYSFVTALAIYDAVCAFLPDGKEVRLKWPNDVLVDGKKICGILLESAMAEGGVVPWLVIGTGINVAVHPESALYRTTSLKAEGAQADVEEVLQTYLESFAKWHETYKTQGFSPLRDRWLDRAKKGGMIARLPSGEIEGTFADLDETGRLVLKLADGSLRTISAADVFFV